MNKNKDTQTNQHTDASHDSPSVPAVTHESVAANTVRRRTAWLVGVGILIVLLVVAVILYLVVLKNEVRDETVVKPTEFTSSQALVDQAESPLMGKKLDIRSIDGMGGKIDEGYLVYSPPAYQSVGHKFKTLPAQSTGIAFSSDSTIAATNYTQLTKFFQDNHFRKITTDIAMESGYLSKTVQATFVNYAEYESDDILCALWHVDASSTSIGAHITSVGCGQKVDYKTQAGMAQPFYTAYSKNNKPSTDLVFGEPETRDGSDGYKYASVYQEDVANTDADDATIFFEGLYYKSSSDKEWTFFERTDGGLTCSDYNTDALKKAFSEIDCYDVSRNTVRKVSAV